jgi:hypothetical protein
MLFFSGTYGENHVDVMLLGPPVSNSKIMLDDLDYETLMVNIILLVCMIK